MSTDCCGHGHVRQCECEWLGGGFGLANPFWSNVALEPPEVRGAVEEQLQRASANVTRTWQSNHSSLHAIGTTLASPASSDDSLSSVVSAADVVGGATRTGVGRARYNPSVRIKNHHSLTDPIKRRVFPESTSVLRSCLGQLLFGFGAGEQTFTDIILPECGPPPGEWWGPSDSWFSKVGRKCAEEFFGVEADNTIRKRIKRRFERCRNESPAVNPDSRPGAMLEELPPLPAHVSITTEPAFQHLFPDDEGCPEIKELIALAYRVILANTDILDWLACLTDNPILGCLRKRLVGSSYGFLAPQPFLIECGECHGRGDRVAATALDYYQMPLPFLPLFPFTPATTAVCHITFCADRSYQTIASQYREAKRGAASAPPAECLVGEVLDTLLHEIIHCCAQEVGRELTADYDSDPCLDFVNVIPGAFVWALAQRFPILSSCGRDVGSPSSFLSDAPEMAEYQP
jgi:hypothetical protein